MAAIALELSKICGLPELGKQECHTFLTDSCQKEALNAGFYVFHWRVVSVDKDFNECFLLLKHLGSLQCTHMAECSLLSKSLRSFQCAHVAACVFCIGGYAGYK